MSTIEVTHADTEWEVPGPGSWHQARAHFPASITPTLQAMYPDSFNRGFAETFADWGVLLDGITSVYVNGFEYSQVVPFDAPGPDGPRPPGLHRRRDPAPRPCGCQWIPESDLAQTRCDDGTPS